MAEVKTQYADNAIGRPRKRLEDLNPNWKQIMHDLAQEGDGPTVWKVHLALSNDGYASLLASNAVFAEAVREAQLLHLAYYERQAKRMINGGAGNSNVFALVMNNKFGWSTNKTDSKVVAEVKADVVTEVKKELTKEELQKQLKARGLPTAILIGRDDDGVLVQDGSTEG